MRNIHKSTPPSFRRRENAAAIVKAPLQAQDDGTIEYAENGTDPVATYTGLDPEGRPVYWLLLATIRRRRHRRADRRHEFG